ncbi:hypothetical protein HYPGJ_10632 [Hyphomicrobium sp. GJ21]|nr:hypothetical protein HYPGJ_10632 [Hyphomicrobium sp. GJ21]
MRMNKNLRKAGRSPICRTGAFRLSAAQLYDVEGRFGLCGPLRDDNPRVLGNVTALGTPAGRNSMADRQADIYFSSFSGFGL